MKKIDTIVVAPHFYIEAMILSSRCAAITDPPTLFFSILS